jgi:hypothetical protein
LGTAAVVCALLGCCLGAPALVGVVLGAVTWRLAAHDLREMVAGRMDPREEGLTRRAWGKGMWGFFASFIPATGVCLVVWRFLVDNGLLP